MKRPRALFTSRNLVGDTLYISPSLNVWHRQHPDYEIGILTNNDFVKPLYTRMGVPVSSIWDNDTLAKDWLHEVSDTFEHNFDVSKAFLECGKRQCHLAEGYAALLGIEIPKGPRKYDHLKPIMIPTPEEIEPDRQGLILVSMFSSSCSSRSGQEPNKMLPWKKWQPILRYLRTLNYPIKFLGAPNDRTPMLDISEDEYMTGVPLNRLAHIMKSARLLVTLDNGMGHLAASQQTPTFLFYPRCLTTWFILPLGNPNLIYVHMDPVILDAAKATTALRQVAPALITRSSYMRASKLASRNRQDYNVVSVDGAID